MVHDIRVVNPKNFGWLEKKLNDEELTYLWNCVSDSSKSIKNELIGQISESKSLNDTNSWFFQNTILPLCQSYELHFSNIGNNAPVNNRHPYYLESFWVNFQKQNEFNPLHGHNGIYSFVIWMKIPTKHAEQNLNPISAFANGSVISTFQISYLDILGTMTHFTYEMNPEIEGTMIFFPSKLQHCVHPFLNCDEERISISGNISMNTNIIYN
jgi:hypothetical protein